MIGKGGEEHRVARVIRAYQAVSLSIAAFALFWTVIFYLDGHRVMAAAEFFPVVAGLICFVLVTKGRLDLFLIVAEFSFLIFVIGFCLMFDVPQNGAPRVTHLFLPVLGMLAYLVVAAKLMSRLRGDGVLIAPFVLLHLAVMVSLVFPPDPQPSTSL